MGILHHGHGIGPTALMQLAVEPAGASAEFARPEVRVAPKLFVDSDQVYDTDRLLFDMREVARSVVGAGQDPRREMSENPEPLSEQGYYFGVGLSMLDTPGGSWRAVRSRVRSSLEVPGRFLAVLGDQTMILADRFERHQPEHLQVLSTQRLSPQWGGLGRRWRHAPDLAERADPATRWLWLRLLELHTILSGAAR